MYVHIPYCRRRCTYCDFVSTGGADAVPNSYVDLLLNEWHMWLDRLGQENYRLETVYFGGGTPSLLSPGQLARLVAAVTSSMPRAGAIEISMEGNPDSLTLEGIRGYVGGGINRLSVGVQSFDDASLCRLGRLHTAAEAEATVACARAAGVSNLSLDLMYGLPGGSGSQELRSLERAIQLGVEHISWYNLTLADTTELGRSVTDGSEVMPDEDEVLATMREGWKMLAAAGYVHYELSNFALPGFECRHNMGYWQYCDYVGLGLGASGCLQGQRWTNVSQMDAFTAAVQEGILPTDTTESLSKRRREGEYAMLRMRLPVIGLELGAFHELFGEDALTVFGESLTELEQENLIVVGSDAIVCTQRGLELNNLVAEALIA